ncbi:MAG: hypothetical protein LBD04_09000 [Synergistaceae bacterium]|nr:hypothetical protein [Synergistaceae bacterium]
MSGEKQWAPEQSLDHATARVVKELADALLPSLREAVREDLTAALSIRTGHVGELADVLGRLREAGNGADAALRDAVKSLNGAAEEARAALTSACQRLEAFVPGVPKEDQPQVSEEVRGLLHAVEEAVSNWEGVLRADGRAHTRELNAFSTEIADLVKVLVPDLGRMLGEAVEKTRSGWEAVLVRQRDAEARLGRLEKMTAALGAVSVFLLTAAVVTLYLLW